MRNKVVLWSMVVVVAVLVCLAIYFFGPEQQQDPSDITFEDESPDVKFADEPEARALYEKMIETMRSADSLSYKSDYRWESKGREIGRCTYTIWMKKPNHFRVETINSGGLEGGILIGDGDYLWSFLRRIQRRFRIFWIPRTLL